MILLCKLLYRNLKGYRFLVILAILLTFAQVGCDLMAAMPLKFIPSKVNNPGSDPACTFPFLDSALSYFDTPLLDPSLRPLQPDQPALQPPSAPCPVNTSDPNSVLHPMITHHSVIGVIVFSLIMLAIFSLLSALMVHFELYLATFIAQNLSANLREQLFDHLQRLSLDWHDRQKKGDLVQRITGNIADVEKLVTDGMVDLLAGILTLVGVAVAMAFISQSYTLLSLSIAPVLFFIVLTYTRGIKAAAKKQAKAAGKIADVATEDINALTVIRAYTLENREVRRFGQYVGSQRAAALRAGSLQSQFTPLVTALLAVGTIIVVGIGGYVAAGNSFSLGFINVGASTVDVGTLVLFLTYLKMLYQPMRDLSKLTTLASNAASGTERIQEVLDQAPEILDSNVIYDGPQRLKGEITFENVFFGYVKNRFVLKGINLHIPAGHKVALVGYSGSGKTTLAKLIPRFYPLEQGAIKIDGVPLDKYPLHILRQNISMVLQDSILFEGTVRENIEVGRPGASMEQIMDAARKANIHNLIMSLPSGYDTHVREQGNNFSGGQRQRLAIARAILRDAPILILDEPTASLDVESEAEVMNAINKLIVGRTVLTISHRLSTLGNVDEILVMRDGQVVEQGTFKHLKEKHGVFAALLEEQMRYAVNRNDEDEAIVRALSAATQPRIPALASITSARQNEQEQKQKALSLETVPVAALDMQRNMLSEIPTVLQPTVSGDLPNLPPDESETAGSQSEPEKAGSQPEPETTEAQSEPETTEAQPEPETVGSQPEPETTEAQSEPETVGAQPLRLPQELPTHTARTKAYVLVEINGRTTIKHWLNRPILTIGRFSTSDIQIASPRVSRFHAIIHWKDGRWVLEDTDSLNGLTYQGQRVGQLTLTDGDYVYLDPSITLLYEEATNRED